MKTTNKQWLAMSSDQKQVALSRCSNDGGECQLMKEAKSSYCGECQCDFTPGELVWYAWIENHSFCETCKNKLNIRDWEQRKVPNREENSI